MLHGWVLASAFLISPTLSNGGGEETLGQKKKNFCFGDNIISVIVDQEIINGSFYQHKEAVAMFSLVFGDVGDRRALLKQKMVRENNAPFMIKELNKAIMDRSRIKNRYYFKWPSRKNFLELKKG